jgi:hypothetical protein
MKMEKVYKNLNESVLSAIEEFWGFGLPKSYRKFLLETNGGIPSNGYFYFYKKKDRSFITSFFGVVKDFNNNILIKEKYANNRVPGNMLPIGRDVYGNLILISVKNKDRGKIYFWDHEMEANTEAGEIADYRNLILISDSFDEFMNGLHSFDENEESEKLDPGSE